MKKVLSLLCFLFVCGSSMAVTRYWVATVAGNYSASSNWNTASNGTGAPGAPSNTDNIVIDRNATITLDGNYQPSSIWITNHAQVVFTTANARTLTIGGGSVAPAFKIESGTLLSVTGTAAITISMYFASNCDIYGTLDFSGTSSKMNYANAGVTTVKTGGIIRYGGTSGNGTGSVTSLVMEAGSIYEIYKDGGSFPTGNYNANSTVLNTGAVNNLPTFLMSSTSGSYGNYLFNSSGYLGTTLGPNNNLTFNNVSIIDDGSGKWVFSTSPSASYTLTINGNLAVASGTTMDINRAASGTQPTTVIVKGNVLIDGTLTESGGNTGSLIELAGNASATFYSAPGGINNDVSIKINKSVANVVATSDIILPNSSGAFLLLSSGNLDVKTNNKSVFVQNPAVGAITGGSLGSHIIGLLKRKTNQAVEYNFPVSNNELQWARANITPASNASSDWSVEFLTPNPNDQLGLTPGIIDAVTDYYWNITSTASASNLKFYYDGLTIPTVISPSQVQVVRWSGSLWLNMGGVDGGGNVANALGTTGAAAPGDPVTTFGAFALGGLSGIVPVKIESFTGVALKNLNKLFWKLGCSEASTILIDLEKSADAGVFSPVYSIIANATRCNSGFEFADFSLIAANNFYRLRLTDQDGRVAYSSIVNLRGGKSAFAATVFPNPAVLSSRLHISSEEAANVQVVIRDMKGSIVRSFSQKLLKGENITQLNLSGLSSGRYNISIFDGKGETVSLEIVK